MKLPISLVIITLNEEKNIKRCIESVPWADDIVVLDSGSKDRTVEIARSLGARVEVQSFLGFRAQKQKATDLAKNDWVLNLDADEALSKELSEEIKNLFHSEKINNHSGYAFPRLSFHLGRWIKHGGWHPDYQLRLYNRTKSKWGGGNVHEKVECANSKYLKNNLLHWVFKDLSHQVDMNNKYSSLGAKDLNEHGKKYSLVKLIFKPLGKFIELYIIKRGFLDGTAGFVIAVGGAYSVFLKFSKLKELQDPKFQSVKTDSQSELLETQSL